MLFRKFADPQTQSLAIPPLRFLVTNTNVPGRSTMRMVDAVGTLVGGPLGKSVGEPLLDAMGASRCMAFAPLGPFSPSLARFAGLLASRDFCNACRTPEMETRPTLILRSKKRINPGCTNRVIDCAALSIWSGMLTPARAFRSAAACVGGSGGLGDPAAYP